MVTGFDWNIGSPIQDDKSYFRDDEDLVLQCMQPEGPSIIRVLGIRRFGKTSFLKKLARRAGSQGKSGRSWIPRFISLQGLSDPGDFGELTRYFSEGLPALLQQSPEARSLVLLDELNFLSESKLDQSAWRERALLVSRIVRSATSGDLCDRLRVIVSEASNMDAVLDLDSVPLESETKNLLKEGRTLYLGTFSLAEKKALLGNVRGPSYEQIPGSLLDFVGGHPMLLQCLGKFLDDRGTSLEEFKSFLSGYSSIGAAYTSIFENLHAEEQVVLRRLVHENAPLGSEIFSSPGGAGGLSVVKRLAVFGLAEGTPRNAFRVGVQALGEFVKCNYDDPGDDKSQAVQTLWRGLFTDGHPHGSEVPTFVVHQMADFHVNPNSTGVVEDPVSHQYRVDGHPALEQYRRALGRLGNREKPHVTVIAGDMIRQDRTMDARQYSKLSNALFKYFEKEIGEQSQRLNSNVRSCVVVPGDTDVLVRRKGEEPHADYDHDFYDFEHEFEASFRGARWDQVQYYRDWNVLVVPLNSAAPSDEEDALQLGRTRFGHMEHGNYHEHRKGEYGCFAQSLDDDLAERIAAARPADDPQGDFDHALRVAVFHHHIDQLTPLTTTVDFKEVERVKQAMARNRISLLLHGHAHKNHLSFETVHDLNQGHVSSWTLHSICCGSMLSDPEPTRSVQSFNAIHLVRERIQALELTGSQRWDPAPRFRYKLSVWPYFVTDGSFGKGNGIFFEVLR